MLDTIRNLVFVITINLVLDNQTRRSNFPPCAITPLMSKASMYSPFSMIMTAKPPTSAGFWQCLLAGSVISIFGGNDAHGHVLSRYDVKSRP